MNMKKLLIGALIMLANVQLNAKDIKTVTLTPTPAMKCEKCAAKIKKQLQFEKGMKDIQIDVPSQTITLTFDAEKTTVENLQKSMEKVGFKGNETTAKKLNKLQKLEKADKQ